MPPRLMRTNLRPNAAAIDLPSEVLPVPGGPTKHRMGLRISFAANLRTAMYSRMRSFALGKP